MSHHIRQAKVCAYCGEPLKITEHGIEAWRVEDKFVCNEYCADGIAPTNSEVNGPEYFWLPYAKGTLPAAPKVD